MKKVEEMNCKLMEEACDALKYAEMYIYYKNTHPEWARTYSQMANDEISHVDMLHTIFQEKIDKVSWMPENATEAWESCVRQATEKIGMAKLILSK